VRTDFGVAWQKCAPLFAEFALLSGPDMELCHIL